MPAIQMAGCTPAVLSIQSCDSRASAASQSAKRRTWAVMLKIFRIYLVESEDEIRKHSKFSGIPVSSITEIPQIIDPPTANT